MFNIFKRKHDTGICIKELSNRIDQIDLKNDELIQSLIEKGRKQAIEIDRLSGLFSRMQDIVLKLQDNVIGAVENIDDFQNMVLNYVNVFESFDSRISALESILVKNGLSNKKQKGKKNV